MRFPCHNKWLRDKEQWELGPVIEIVYPKPLTGNQMTSPVGLYKGELHVITTLTSRKISDIQDEFDILARKGYMIYPYGWNEIISNGTITYKFKFVKIAPIVRVAQW